MDTGGCFIRSTQIRFSTGFSNSLRRHKWIPPSRLIGNRPTFARDLPRSCTMGFRSITLFFVNLLQSCIEDVVQRKRGRTPPAHDSPLVVDLSSLMAPMPPPAHVWSVVRTWPMICFEIPRITTSGSPAVTTGTSIVQPIHATLLPRSPFFRFILTPNTPLPCTECRPVLTPLLPWGPYVIHVQLELCLVQGALQQSPQCCRQATHYERSCLVAEQNCTPDPCMRPDRTHPVSQNAWVFPYAPGSDRRRPPSRWGRTRNHLPPLHVDGLCVHLLASTCSGASRSRRSTAEARSSRRPWPLRFQSSFSCPRWCTYSLSCLPSLSGWVPSWTPFQFGPTSVGPIPKTPSWQTFSPRPRSGWSPPPPWGCIRTDW